MIRQRFPFDLAAERIRKEHILRPPDAAVDRANVEPDRIRRIVVPATFALLVVSAPNGPPHEAPLVSGAILGTVVGLLACGLPRPVPQ